MHAFTRRSFYTQIVFQRITEALTQRSPYITQRIFLHTEAFTHRQLPTEAFMRSFYAQELLHTNAFTHRSLYTRRLLHTGALSQTSLTQSSFYTLQNRKFTGFLMFGHHVMRKGYIWRSDAGQSFCVKGLRLTLETRNLHTFYLA